jgi:hypothetical protein
VLQGAAPLDSELDALWRNISRRRAANMQLLAKDLAATGRLRSDFSRVQGSRHYMEHELA